MRLQHLVLVLLRSSYRLLCLCCLGAFGFSALAQVTINSPAANSTSISAVRIAASAVEGESFHLEVWDNGYKLGNVFANSVNGVYVLPNGSHKLTVNAVSSNGTVLNGSTLSYSIAENCINSTSVECDVDRQGIDNTQNVCNPREEALWAANPCGSGIQGANGVNPSATSIQAITQAGAIPDQNNTTLNGQSIHLSEVQGSGGFSNVLFDAQTPQLTSTTQVQSRWTLDEYVYLPNPAAHQAFEMDVQYVVNGIWTKFYTECAFNINSGQGYWGVFDSNTGGWMFLNGQSQNGQTPPAVPCNRSQFAQPWSGSSNPSFTGWHHIVWNFLRNNDGSVTFQTLTFDGTTTQVNFSPNSGTGGAVSNNGDFGALIQLDGVANPNGQSDTVDAYINELNITHTQ